MCILPLSAQDVIITGLLDPTVSGATPRALELYVSGTVDLAAYRIELYSNDNLTVGRSTDLEGTYTDEFVYVINTGQEDDFNAAFGDAGDFSNRIRSGTFVSGNGNDAFVLRLGEATIDQTGGVIGEEDNIYRDSYLYRVDGTGPDGDWAPGNWMNVGNNDLLDGVGLDGLAAIVPFGSYAPPNAGPSVSVDGASDLAEPATNGAFTVTLSEPATAPVTVTYVLGGTATEGVDYASPSGSATIAAGDTITVIDIAVLDDAEAELIETIILELVTVSDATYSLGRIAAISLEDDEPIQMLAIHEVQGAGMESPVQGFTVTVEGIVVGDFQGGSGVGLDGFYVQEENADADADAGTSEGIFVYDPAGETDVMLGDLVSVTGQVQEFGNQTQLNTTTADGNIALVSSDNVLPAPSDIDFPLTTRDELERYEGMFVRLTDDAVVTGTSSLGRFGELEISSGERLTQFTECNAPNPGALAAYNAEQDLRRILIEDGAGGANPATIRLPDGTTYSGTNPLRAGTSYTGLRGVMDERFGNYRIQATGVVSVDQNERPTTPPDVGGNLKIAGMNVLNYFTTFGERGADNQAELDRQTAKIVAAICALDADIIGLVEIENNGTDAGSATQALIDAITAGCGKTYAAVVSPETGTDQIKVQLIYDVLVVEESGTAAALSSPADVFSRNRVPTAQTFRITDEDNDGFGGQITVVANHWKSKAGGCRSEDDCGGGAGAGNGTRIAAATAIKDWLATDPTGTGVTNQLIVGDLNAYSREAPITNLTDAGFVNLVREFAPDGSFPCGSLPSYVFGGEWGSLDHALASADLAPFVTGAAPWNVNAAEPTALAYDGRDDLYSPDFYRFSDHDPVLVGVRLETALPVELTNFTGSENKGRVDLAWRVGQEEDVARYEVQRRELRGGFVTIGEVVATRSTTYTFADGLPLRGDNAYRLRVVDTDGAVAHSGLVVVSVRGPHSVQLRTAGDRNYQLHNAPLGTDYAVVNTSGQLLRGGVVRADVQSIEAGNLPAGMYFLSLRLAGGERSVFKFVLR